MEEASIYHEFRKGFWGTIHEWKELGHSVV